MAGDWLKMELCLPHKPEVLAMSAKTGMEPDLIVGKCFRLWSWFDQHTKEGNSAGVTLVTLSYAIGNGDANIAFLDALKSVGWIVEDEQGISLPNFDRHNGETAKTRALTAKRVAKHKSKSNAESNGDSVTSSVNSALPREEKRREDKNINTFVPKAALLSIGVTESVAVDWLQIRKAKKSAVTETAIKGLVRECELAGISVNDALVMCCERGWSGFKSEWILNQAKTKTHNPAVLSI